MRQQIEICVLSSVDIDAWLKNQARNERELQELLNKTVNKFLKTKSTETFIEYGEPV